MRNKRIRAIDQLCENSSIDKWKGENDLFKQHTGIFDDTFFPQNCLHTDYIPRKLAESDNQATDYKIDYEIEETIICNALSNHGDPLPYLLIGTVGTGKSTLCNHIVSRKSKLLNDSFFAFTVDASRVPQDESVALNELWIRLQTQLIATATENSFFPTIGAFYKKYLEYLTLTFEEENSLFRTISERSIQMLRFIFSIPHIENILIVVDNSDDNNSDSLKTIITFVTALNNALTSNNPPKKKSSLIFTLRDVTERLINRDYNPGYFRQYNQRKYRLSDFSNYQLFFTKKIDLLINKFSNGLSDVTVPGVQHKHSNTLIKYVITAESAKKYLIHITQQIFNEQNGISDLLKIISNGNIKKYLLCMYFFFHSCKVRISPLFKAFLEEKPIGDKLTEHFFIEALMAVHTPFFDTQASQLPNIFNAGNFCEKNSWANTLSIIRILQFLHHNPQPAQKKELFNFFMEHGYDSNILSSAFETAFEFHLIVAPCGSRARDVAQSDTIKISKFGKYCLDCLLKEISYLQYIVDDTPMLKDYITPISEKYCIDDYKINRNSSSPKETKTSKRKRMEAIDMFIKFLQLEEDLEEEMVLGLNKNYAYYKGRLGFHIEGNNASLAEYIDRETRTGRENIINHING